MMIEDVAAIGSKYAIPNNLSRGVDFLIAPASTASKVEHEATPINTNNIILSELLVFSEILSAIKMNNNNITEANSGLKTKFSEGFL
jgi:hypothetical protein